MVAVSVAQSLSEGHCPWSSVCIKAEAASVSGVDAVEAMFSVHVSRDPRMRCLANECDSPSVGHAWLETSLFHQIVEQQWTGRIIFVRIDICKAVPSILRSAYGLELGPC